MEKFLTIIDLHCDLLCYLQKDHARTPFDPQVRCSLPQLQEGNVKTQVMAVFADTGKSSSIIGAEQIDIFLKLQNENSFFQYGIDALLAIENASSLLDEEEPLTSCFNRLDNLKKEEISPLYIGMTWNPENRFGGGAATSIGLKPDGKTLLHYLDGKGIAIDFSHASDPLATEILNEIDRSGFNIPVIASHSNARAVYDIPRNLPDFLIKEIVRRKGLIGINYVTRLLGEGKNPLMAAHIAHMLSLGAEHTLAIGSDFFYSDDWAATLNIKPEETFYSEYPTAATHQKVLKMVQSTLNLSKEQLERFACGNVEQFLERNEIFKAN